MSEIQRMTDQLDRACKGGAWHGPAVFELLQDVTAEQASARPVADAHTIWEIALHIGAWLRAGRMRLDGQRAQFSDVEDWPPVTETTMQAWTAVTEQLKHEYEQLRAAIQAVDESQLDQPILEGMSSVYVTLHGVIQRPNSDA
jgi:hypothetical protein